tara:strand:- start:4068 stop:5735 length:1668 start_codon:yes stop_codon:yes gene_type:complete
MSYQVLSRKWRPQLFEDVIGQTHITRTLQNAILKERVAHGFLFCGVRGVGKTTTARIFSKALNCVNINKNNPCNSCNNCKDITIGRSLDVLEIDGASNRGIDEIRELREAVKYPPANGKFRIYIIDEVHMLTTHAFNALLKTLEEPPAHVKFILATTDPQKLPQTILSRTLRFEFKRVQLPLLKDYIKKILNKEDIEYDVESIIQIAKKGDGSVRDSLSILDQAIAYTGGSLQIDKVQEILGMISESLYCSILTDIITKNKQLIVSVHKALNAGVSLPDFIIGFNHYLNQVMLLKSGVEIELELAEETVSMVNEYENLKVLDLLRIIEITQNFESGLRYMNYPQLNLDSMLIKLLSMDSTITISEVLEGQVKNIPLSPFSSIKANTEVTTSIIKKKQVKIINKTKVAESEEPISDDLNADIVSSKIKNSEINHKLDLNFFIRNWGDFLDQVEAEHPKFLTYLSEINLKSFENDKLTIEINAEDRFNAKGIKKNQTDLERIFKEYSGEEIKLILEIKNEKMKKLSVSEIKEPDRGMEGHPLFETIMDTFDGEIIRS